MDVASPKLWHTRKNIHNFIRYQFSHVAESLRALHQGG
jgi:hypothetical protein